MVLSRRIYRLQNTDAYYVESETRDDQYYFWKFKPEILESCSCKDNSTRRHLKCKHLFAIEFAIKWGTFKDIDKSSSIILLSSQPTTIVQQSKSYLDDEYDF
jgi:hypothetical protein